jgi:LDH2 family malate/lactate/ureidoglycolate dehydrogenase
VERVRIDAQRLIDLAEALFRHDRVAPDDAATIARVQIEADLRGMHSHGMRAIPMYLERIQSGVINPRPMIQVTDQGLAAIIDGDDGPGQVVASRAMEECIARAGRFRVGLALVRRSNHFGAAGYYAGMAVASDLIGIATTNGNLVLAPWGGVTPTVGNNPIAVGVPAGSESPILLDVATSVVAGGKIDLAAAEGDALPDGWAFDANGQPTRELAQALSGLGVPLGAPAAGHKGFGLAFAMEVLAGALTGARVGREHTAEVDTGPRPWDEGHFFLAIDPSLAMPIAEFKARIDRMICEVRETRSANGEAAFHAPGELAARRREEALRDGIQLPASIWRRLRECATERGITVADPTSP